MKEKTKVSIRIGLNNVEDKGNAKTKDLQPKITEFLNKEITEKHGIRVGYACKENQADLIKDGSKYGFAFAFSKFDEAFTETVRSSRWGGGLGEYRYKTKEVNAAIKKMVDEFDLDPNVKYDRGMGVFVYNVFVK